MPRKTVAHQRHNDAKKTAGLIAPESRGVFKRSQTQQSVMLLLFLLTQENFGLVETLKTTVSAAQEARGMMNLPGDEDDVRTLNTLTQSHTIGQSHRWHHLSSISHSKRSLGVTSPPPHSVSSYIVRCCAMAWCCVTRIIKRNCSRERMAHC